MVLPFVEEIMDNAKLAVIVSPTHTIELNGGLFDAVGEMTMLLKISCAPSAHQMFVVGLSVQPSWAAALKRPKVVVNKMIASVATCHWPCVSNFFQNLFIVVS